MLSNILKNISSLWQKLSDREKNLARLTAAAIALMVIYTGYQRAMARLDDLDMTIMRLEDDLVSYTFQIAHRELVESRYAAIASQHSSAWTEAEIHDRLRQEIYRLARNTPPPLDENGIPLNQPEDGNLVEIPSLGKGNMAEGGKGYREYRLNLRIPPCPLANLITFLERLQQSPQSLRIDALELNRAIDGNVVSASIDITRIVADGATDTLPAREVQTVATGTGRIMLRAQDWVATGAEIQDVAEAGSHGAVDIQATADTAEVYLLRSLPGGTVYEMIMDLAAAQGEVVLGVGLESEETPFEGAQSIVADGSVYRIHLQFTLPGAPGTDVQIKCPLIRMQGTDAVVHVANLLLRSLAEV